MSGCRGTRGRAINTITHHTVYQPGDPNPRLGTYAPWIEGEDLHIYSHWAETAGGEKAVLRSHISHYGPGAIAVTVSGWRRSGHHPIYSVYYFMLEGGSWIRRRRSHHSVQAILADTVHTHVNPEETTTHE